MQMKWPSVLAHSYLFNHQMRWYLLVGEDLFLSRGSVSSRLARARALVPAEATTDCSILLLLHTSRQKAPGPRGPHLPTPWPPCLGNSRCFCSGQAHSSSGGGSCGWALISSFQNFQTGQSRGRGRGCLFAVNSLPQHSSHPLPRPCLGLAASGSLQKCFSCFSFNPLPCP